MGKVLKSEREAAATVVQLYNSGVIQGYKLARGRKIKFVEKRGLRDSGIHASDTVLHLLKRAKIPRF